MWNYYYFNMPKFLALFFIFLFTCLVFSQNDVYKFKHLSTTEGLSQSAAVAIIQDDLGQIWIGTRDGLNKYDGSNFTIYRHNKANPSSISNSDVLCMEQDSYGFIWVGTAAGLNKYDPKKDTFKSYFINNSSTSLQDNIAWSIKELTNKQLWIGTSSGISIYNKTSDSFISTLPNERVFSIFETKKGKVFIGTKNGLKQLVRKTAKGYQFITIKGTERFYIQDIIETTTGDLLLGTRFKSVLEYKVRTGIVSPYFKETTLINKNKNVRKLLFDTKGNLWIGTYNGLQIADNSRNIKTLYSDINDSEVINDNFIKSLFKDKNGSIWVGTYYGGINFWDESNVNFINITQKPGGLGIGFKVVSSIVKKGDLLFLGTEGGGVSILNTVSKSIEHINTKNNPALKSNNIKALTLTKDNNLWIGTFEDGFVVYDIVTKSFTSSSHKELLSYLESTGVYCLQQDHKDNMLIGTIGKGLLKYNLTTKTFKVFDGNTKPNGLLSGFIRSIKVDSKNNIWLGTLNGLNVIDAKGQIKKYFYDEKVKIGFSMTTVFEDSKGAIWAGTEGEGFFKFIKNTFEAVNLKSTDATDITGIRSILEDEKGNFWISTVSQGILYYNPSKNKILVNYTSKEGLVSDQYNNNSSLHIEGSDFYFGGPTGVVFFNGNKLFKNKYSPQVIITDLKVKNKSITANDETNLLSKTITFTEEIDLSYEQGNFNISFSIPNFINASSNSYEYRLKGLEKDWNKTTQNSVSYTIQNPGNYTFEVRGVNSDGVSNTEPTILKIHVNPAPWRTWWAFMLYGIFIFSCLYYLLGILKSKAKLRHQLDLEIIEAQQTEEINKAKLEFFTNISHEFRTPLTLILGPLHQILENYRGNSLMYKKLKVIEGSANHLLQLINRLMDFRKLENNLVKLETAEGNIVKFLKEIYLSFTEYAKDGKYDYSFHSSTDEILVFYDRYKLERVFYNLISNAFRYTPKTGKITIRVIEEHGNVIIQVEDTGVGVAVEYQDKIFERFFEVAINNKPDNDYNKGTGIGLSIAKNIVDLHKGKIAVQPNIDGLGSIFSVTLSLGSDHLLESEIIQDFKFSDDLSQYVDQLEEQPLIDETDPFDNLLSQSKPTILLVEDNKQLRKFMRDLLIEKYNIFEAENGKVAFKLAQTEPIDLIVSDVVMPIMTGTELCALIKEDIRTSHIPLILLTSRSSLIYKLEGLETGADDYISKPFNSIELKLRIKNLLTSIHRLKQKMSALDTPEQEDVVLSSLDDVLYKKALQIVEKNIGNEQFDILFFCEELGVSRTVLFKKVKAWTDFTPNEFVQHIRLKKGAQFLEQGKMNISQISYKLGFNNPKYFSKCFRKKFGKTPTEYVKMFMDT